MNAGNGIAATVPPSGSTQHYHHFKDRLLGCLEAVAALDSVVAGECRDLKERLTGNLFNLVVVGQFKRGKTCLINALLGVDLLPVAVVPLTSIVTILTYGETLRIEVIYNDGRTGLIRPEELTHYVTEMGNPRNTRGVREVVVQYPSAYLKEGVRLVDTPGVGSAYRHNTDVAYQYLPKSDAALFLLSVEQPASQAELDFLGDVHQYADRIFFLLNKIDYLSGQELEQSIEFSRQVIREVMQTNVKLFPISAKLALEGQLTDNQGLLEQSRLPAFAELLTQFLVREKGTILLSSVIGHLSRLVSQVRCRLELESKALGTSLDELRVHITAFDRKRQEIVGDQRKLRLLLDDETNRLIRADLDVELSRFQKELIEQMEKGVEQWRQENQQLPLEELNEALESYISAEVQQAFQGWRAHAEDRLAAGFNRICRGYLSNINDSIDSLMRFSSKLFDISFDPVRIEPTWDDTSHVHFLVKDDPVALELLADSVTVLLPRIVGKRFSKIKNFLVDLANRIVLGKVKEKMYHTINMQGGRTRYYFVERLNKSKNLFYKSIMEKLDITIAGLDNALDQGFQLRSQGEEQVGRHRIRLEADLRQIDRVYQDLLDIRNGCLGSRTQDQGVDLSERIS
ncbi:MAG TPA: dynamin [Syntrophobacteraceae bacterium]|nr:dynamin [Syntrophobacteraceae bacterium]